MSFIAAGEAGTGTLVEVQPFKYSIVEKSKQDGVLMTLEGTFQRADTQNANKRVYPKSLWQKVMKDEDVNVRLQSRRMLGELDHPASGATSLSRVSHVITHQELTPKGEIKGRMDILDTPAGRIAETLFKAGVQLGISSRGDGSVEKRDGFAEVQGDFRLETYDLVLKPSTPGAYPQVVECEEDAQRNVNLIADAVEGLVNGSSDVNVLLECHKIISVLEGCETRREDIQKQLTERLRLGVEPNNPVPKDDDMKTTEGGQAGGGDLSPELAALIREHAEALVGEKLAEKDQEIARLNQIIVTTTQEKEGIEERLDAAEQLIEEFQRKVEELSEKQTGDEQLQLKFEAALKLIDEATSRLQELGDTKRRLDAAKGLLAASIDRHKEDAVNKAVEAAIGDLDEAVQKKLRPILESCGSPVEVQKRFDELSDLMEGLTEAKVEREPLPSSKGKETSLTEGKSDDSGKVLHGDFITRRLMGRISGNVR